MDIILTGRIEFLDDENRGFNRGFKATLTKSKSFDYGNGTAVTISFSKMANGYTTNNILIDTRYDITIKKDIISFKKWLNNYFKNNYCKNNIIFD